MEAPAAVDVDARPPPIGPEASPALNIPPAKHMTFLFLSVFARLEFKCGGF